MISSNQGNSIAISYLYKKNKVKIINKKGLITIQIRLRMIDNKKENENGNQIKNEKLDWDYN